jgi:hypothetical protein
MPEGTGSVTMVVPMLVIDVCSMGSREPACI